MDLSVIVPVYNLEKFLPKFLYSLEKQELGEYTVEYILVDNNSTDRSVELLEKANLPNKQVLHCEKQGCGCARNVGIEKANGKYIWFMDGDDWLTEPVSIMLALDKAKSKDYSIIRIPFKSETFRRNHFSMVWQYVIRKDLIEGILFPEYQPCEDDAFMKEVLERTKYDKATYTHMPHPNIPLYFYNYLREGSNMYRYLVLNEDLNI